MYESGNEINKAAAEKTAYYLDRAYQKFGNTVGNAAYDLFVEIDKLRERVRAFINGPECATTKRFNVTVMVEDKCVYEAVIEAETLEDAEAMVDTVVDEVD